MPPPAPRRVHGFLRHFVLAQVWAFLIFLPALMPLSDPGNRYVLFWSRASAPVHLACVMAFGAILHVACAILRKLSATAYPRTIITMTGILLAGLAWIAWRGFAESGGVIASVYAASAILGAVGLWLAVRRWRWTASMATRWIERGTLFISTLLPIYWINLFAAPTFDLRPGILAAQPPGAPAAEKPAGDVYIFILDAWSYRLTFEDGEVLPYLPHLKAAASGMCSFTDAHAPGCHTINSLPRFLFQREGDFALRGNEVGFWTTDFQPCHELESLFFVPRQRGYRTCMIGWYHPYEIVLRDAVDVVISCNTFRWRGEEPWEIGLQFYQQAAKILLDKSFLGDTPPARAIARQNHAFVRNTELIVSHVKRIIDAPGPAHFAVFHVPLPHVPFCYSPEGARPLEETYSLDSVELAREQLVYTDGLIGDLMARLERLGKYERATIVLTSDHTWRSDPELPAGSAHHWSHVPLLIKFPGQKKHVRIDRSFTTSRLMRFLEAMRARDHDLSRLKEVLYAESFHVPVSDAEAGLSKVKLLLK